MSKRALLKEFCRLGNRSVLEAGDRLLSVTDGFYTQACPQAPPPEFLT